MTITLQALDDAKIIEASKQQFPSISTRLDQCDLFMKDVKDGTYSCNFLDHSIFVSTQYAYEDILVNGNQTRYKLHVKTLELLDTNYSINFSWDNRYYAIYEENQQIKFIEYSQFLEFITKGLQIIE